MVAGGGDWTGGKSEHEELRIEPLQDVKVRQQTAAAAVVVYKN